MTREELFRWRQGNSRSDALARFAGLSGWPPEDVQRACQECLTGDLRYAIRCLESDFPICATIDGHIPNHAFEAVQHFNASESVGRLKRARAATWNMWPWHVKVRIKVEESAWKLWRRAVALLRGPGCE